MSYLMAIDPGVKRVGYALFREHTLITVGLLTIKSQRALYDDLWNFGAARVVVEIPQVYKLALSKGDPNDLIDVALVAGVCLACAPIGIPVRPREWKGQVDKAVMTARILANAPREDREKLEYIKPKSLVHNVIDAYGLGRWYLAREGTK